MAKTIKVEVTQSPRLAVQLGLSNNVCLSCRLTALSPLHHCDVYLGFSFDLHVYVCVRVRRCALYNKAVDGVWYPRLHFLPCSSFSWIHESDARGPMRRSVYMKIYQYGAQTKIWPFLFYLKLVSDKQILKFDNWVVCCWKFDLMNFYYIF